MNPLCQCGCEREVRYPSNKYVLGHVGFKWRALTDEQQAVARGLRKQGLSQAEIARRLGTTQTTIFNRIGFGDYASPEKHVHTVTTQDELDRRFARHMLRKAKTSVKKVRQTMVQLKRTRRGE